MGSQRTLWCMSPLSLSALVATLAAGCSGHTLERALSFVGCQNLDQLKTIMSKVLSMFGGCTSTTSIGIGGEGKDRSSPKISLANAIWADKRPPLKPSYLPLVVCVTDSFKSDAKNVDFLFQTENRNFFLPSGNKVSVPFMTNSGPHQYGYFHDFQVLELPYQRGTKEEDFKKKFRMQIILPYERSDGLQNLLEKFNKDSSRFLNWQHFPGNKSTDLDFFSIPKFKFSCSLDNIRSPFMEEAMELIEMLHSGDPSISNIIHKAFIQVGEEGTEAAAVSLCMVAPALDPIPKYEKLSHLWLTILSCLLSKKRHLDQFSSLEQY